MEVPCDCGQLPAGDELGEDPVDNLGLVTDDLESVFADAVAVGNLTTIVLAALSQFKKCKKKAKKLPV